MFITKTNLETKSHIGGHAVLPMGQGKPSSITGVPLTFFFTIQFPSSHKLNGYTLSFFSATDEFDENFTIPEMLSTDLKNARIPQGFLRDYQKFFKAFLFKTELAYTAEDDEEKIKIQYLEFSDQEVGEVFGLAGLSPKWILEDESPSSYEGESLEFLLQVRCDQAFEIIETAPPQKEMDIFGGTKDRKKKDYFFFNQNEVFYFGQPSGHFDDNVYIITQCE
ncbi:hypothetical protein V2J74_27450 [Pseudomonas alliivorans]|nr:hypothetical protein [Pseudomonas alliivorans]MEE5067588.1 hypothetical protein [Pseudomonas alliivorans]MEE5088490.1 hypothetical protein [Pseudomonas alliivorans]